MEENGLTPQVDTTAFTMQGNPPVRMPDTQTPMTFASPTVETSQMSPETTNMVNNVRFDALGTVNRKNNVGSVMEKLFPDAKKLDLSTTVPLTETHEQLNDGETWLPKYSSYLPGVDNEARLARQQTNFDKFLNPVKRFVSNTAKAPLDIASFVYGVGDAAISGRFDALYDNSFSKYVDDLTTKTNFNYKNYYDKSQSDLGFNLYTWDKFGSGAEFTARMLASEALIAVATGGTSVPASMAKWGLKGALYADRAIEAGNIVRAGNKLSKMFRIAIEPELEVAAKGANVARTFERMTQGLETAANRGAWGDRLVQLRFATTSPMYEAGFEAMHFRKEAQQDFWNYYNQMGKEPTTEEINKFNDKMDGAANAVFGLNMGILSISNLALFGDMLNIKNPLAKYMTSDVIKSNVFRIGTEAGENGLKQAMKAGFWNKTAAYASPFLKGALIEGVYEEGSQGIASSTFKNYAASSYNKDYMQNSSDYASAFSKAFSDQFSTKEGIEEVVIGALVGGIFGGVGGGINTRKEYARQEGIATLQNAGQEFIDNYRGNAYTNEQLLSLFSHANRFQDIQAKMENAEATGDKFKQAQLSAESFTSLLNAYHTVGKESEFVNMWSSMMTGMDNQALAESTGLPIDQIDAFKSEQIQNMTQFASNYSKGREAAEYMFRPNIGGFTEIEDESGTKSKVNYNNLVDAFSYSYGMSFFNQKYATETFDAFQNKLAELTRNQDLVNKFGALGALKMANPLDVAKYNDLEQKLDEANQRLGTLTDELNQLNRSENKANLGDQLISKAREIDNIQRRLESLNSDRTLVWNSMIDNFYTKMDTVGFAEQMDLKNFTEQVNNIQETLNNSVTNQADKLLLNQLLDQFDEANEAYKSYSNLVTRLGDPRFTYKTYRGLFGNKRASVDKSLNEHTRDTLTEIYNSDYNTALSTAFATNTPTESTVTGDIVANMNNEDYQPTPEIIESLKNKLNQRRTLTDNEQAYYDKFKSEVDNYQSEDTTDPLQSSSDATKIDSAKLQVRLKESELYNLMEGMYSPELQERIDKIIENEQNRVQQEEELRRVTQENVNRLNQEIRALENEIAGLEESKRLDQERVDRTVNANKTDYQQFEYTKPNGDVIIGHLEINKGILQIVNADEIVDIKEETVPLRNLNTDNISGLSRVQEDDILIEDNEIYINGKIYRFKNLDDAIKEDESGNYTVTLKSRNGRNVVFRGEIADKIVYENLLNKLTQEATDERIEQLNRQTETDKVLEEKYEELVSKTENRDSQKSEITPSQNITSEEITRRSKLYGWGASYELAKLAKEQGVILANLNREEYAQFAIDNYLRIDDSQLRTNPLHRDAESAQEVLDMNKNIKNSLTDKIRKAYDRFYIDMMELSRKSQSERFISPDVRILSGTQNSNSWLFFAINNGLNDNSSDTYKSYFSLGNINDFDPSTFKDFMIELQKRGYNGGVKIFQDLEQQFPMLNDQVVMHGYSQQDAELALQVALEFYGDKITDSSVGKDEVIDGKNKSYSQILSEKINQGVKDKIDGKSEVQNNTQIENNTEVNQEAIESQQKVIQEEKEAVQERRLEELSQLDQPLFPMSDENNWGQDLTTEQKARQNEYEARRKEINDRYDIELEALETPTPQSTNSVESTVDTFSENQEVQSQIEQAIAQEQVRLEGELADLRDNATLQERKEQLVKDIQNLTAELLEQETPDTYKVSLLNQMELQLDALNNIPVPFNPNDTYFNQLDWIIKNIPRLNFETVEDLAGIQPPSEADVMEYSDLLSKDTNTTEEKRRIAELREALLPFNLADGLSLDGMNILDIVDLYNQSKKIQNINENQQVEMPEEEMQRVTKDVKDVEKTTSFKSASVGLNYDGAYIEQRSKNQTISHIHLTTMLIKSIQKGFNPQIIVYDEKGDVEATLDVTRDNLENLGNTYDNVRNIKVVLSPEVYVRKPLTSTSFNVYGEILPLLDLRAYAITGQPTSFNLIYDENIDGTFSAAESEFDVSIDGNILNFDKEVLNGIKAGDTVTLEFQPNDDYNKTLTPDEYVTKANIYVRKNGKLVNILKASDVENKTNSDSWNNLDATRRRVMTEYNKGRNVELTVSDSYLGLPIINLNENGSPIEVPLDERKVLGYGYVDVDGTMKGDIANIQIDNQQYVQPLLQYGKATPVVAFEAYGKTFAFPIILRTGVNTTYDSDIDAIANDTFLSREQKIFQLNNLLEMNGMLTQDVAQSNNNFNIETVRNALNSIYKKVDVTNPQEFENAVKTAFIDLNNPFMSSKLVLNLISAENEVNVAKIETEVTDGNQNPNVSITTIDGKGRDASENKICP